jgi:phosphatidylglycerophosphate synthase
VVDLITLSRGAAAAVLVGLAVSRIRDRRGFAGWLGWLALLYGSILCDWLDGPMARHLGTSETGALFDLETDSWLTLCTAGSAVAWGDLPVTVASAPMLRYILMFFALRDTPYAGLHVEEPGWVRRAGIAQMLLFIAALAPFGGRATWAAVQLTCSIQTPTQIAGLLLLEHRRRRR